jgi:hypothetical protein
VPGQVACTSGGPAQGLGVRARAERTENMPPMLVTLEVSKLLSGWLNEFAFCRESKGGRTRCGARCGPGGGRAWNGVAAQVACTSGGPTQGLGVRARAERTENMPPMLVTLEVSKLLSGWLNEFAPCRIK